MVLQKVGQSGSHLYPPAHPAFRAPGPLPPTSAGPGGWESGCLGSGLPDQVPRSHHLQGLQSPGARQAASLGFEAQMVGRPRGQAAQRAPPHYCPGCLHHGPCWGPHRAGDGSGVRGSGWCLGVRGKRVSRPGQGSGPSPGCDCGAAWTCQDWGFGTWARAAPGCCHPHPPSWYLSCLCCWPTPR